MKSRLLTIITMVSASCLTSYAQSTVNYAAAPGQRDVLDVEGKPLANGNYVAIGFFDIGFDVALFADNLMALSEAWNEYSYTSIQTVFGQPGRFAGNGSSMDPVFDTKKIYLWIFETSNNSAPLAGYGNVTGYGLYSSGSENWAFPLQGSLPPVNTTSVNSSEVSEAFFGAFDGNHLVLQPIPEPNALFVLLLGAAPIYWLARRKS